MANNITAPIVRVMKLLTPGIISGLTKATSLRNKSAPILGLGHLDLDISENDSDILKSSESEVFTEDKAKIIPFQAKTKPSINEASEENQQISRSHSQRATAGSSALAFSREESVLEGIGVHSRRTIEEMHKQKEEEEKRLTPTAAEFIIAERERNRECNRKISESTALGTYEKQSQMKSGGVGKTESGVLLNKNRF